MNCYKVTVKTSGYPHASTYHADGNPHTLGGGKYLTCEDGTLYIICESPAAIETLVHPDCILNITRLGLGVTIP